MKRYLPKILPQILERLIFHAVYIIAIAAMPYIIRQLVDEDFSRGMNDAFREIMLFAMCIVIGMAAEYVSQRASWKVDRKFYLLIRQDLFCAILRRSPGDFRKNENGEYVSWLTNSISACEEYLENMLLILESAIGLVTYAVYIFVLDFRIALVIYGMALLTVILPRLTGEPLSRRRNRLLEETGRYTTETLDLLGGYSLLNQRTRDAYENRHRQMMGKMEDSRVEYGFFKTFVNVFNGSVMYLVNLGCFAALAILLFRGQISAGIAAAAIAYIQDFASPLRFIIDSASSVRGVKGALGDVMDVIHRSEENTEDLWSDGRDSFREKISMNDCAVSFQGFELNGLTFDFRKGRKYVLVGESGSGKSTVLGMLAGMLEPDSGSICIDGVATTLGRCRETMFYLDQNAHVFSADFYDNVSVFGSYRVKDSASEHWAEITRRQLKASENAALLSGGEKQIIKSLQGLSSGHGVLLLDEPFSALDAETELRLSREILRDEKLTVIMSTHNENPEFLSEFDEVIRMDAYGRKTAPSV